MMNPRLVAVSGPLQGSIIFLSGEEVSIGRGEENQVSLPSTYVSRCHCLVEPTEGRFRIRDLGSSNGTIVNDLPVQERWLEHGDRMRIGDSLFLFLAHDEEEAQISREIELRADGASTCTTAVLGSEKVAELQRGGASAGPGSQQHFARHLSALFKLSSTIASTRGTEALQRRPWRLPTEGRRIGRN
jgi:predicted component of type VI protein secretion system